jgi:hypothetical protein
MRIQLKKRELLGNRRIDTSTTVDSVLVKENILDEHGTHVSLYFKGHDASGILTLTPKEVNKLVSSLKPAQSILRKTKKISNM